MLSRLDKRTLVITPTTPITVLPDTLADLDAHLGDNGAISINYRTGKDSITDMLAKVKAAGLSIADLKTEEPDLEDVFMSLTYGS